MPLPNQRPTAPAAPSNVRPIKPATQLVAEFHADLAACADAATNIDAQSRLAEKLQSCTASMPEAHRDELVQQLAIAIHRPAPWVAQLIRLPLPDLRRALRVEPVRLQRNADEAIYPTDGWLGSYLLYTQETEAPLGWHFWCGVALLAVAARRNLYWDRGRYFLYLNHYLLLLGQSGLTKSTTVNQIMGMFDEAVGIIRDASPLGVDPIYRSPERITAGRLLLDLSTWTKTVGAERRDTTMFVVSDELASMLGRDVKGSDQLADLLTDIYMGKKSHRDSTIVSGDRSLTNVVATCLFATTADSARRNITENMFTEGFMGRVITIARSQPHGRYPTPPAADPVQRRMLAEQLSVWMALDTDVELRLSPEANTWYEAWYYAHRDAPPADPKLNAFWNRKADHVFRLAGILKLSRLVDHRALSKVKESGIVYVELAVMQQALALLEDEEARLPDAFSEIGANQDARDVWRLRDWIRKWCTDNQAWVHHAMCIRANLHYAAPAVKFGQMMQVLLDQDEIEVTVKVSRNGKPARLYKPRDLKLAAP